MNETATAWRIDIEDQIKEARRELGARKRVYPKMYERGTLTQEEMTYRLAAQLAIIATLEGVRDSHKPKLNFD